MKKLIGLFVLYFSIITNAATGVECKIEFTPNKSQQKAIETKVQDLINGSFNHHISPEHFELQLKIYRALQQVNSKKFFSSFKKSLLPKELPKDKLHLSTPSKMLQFDLPEVTSFELRLFHFTPNSNLARDISNGRNTLKLARKFNHLPHLFTASGGSRIFLDKAKGSNAIGAIFEIKLKEDTKILDLSRQLFGDRKAAELSYFDAYEWYSQVLLPGILKEQEQLLQYEQYKLNANQENSQVPLEAPSLVYSNKFPQIASLLKEYKKEALYILENTEAFAIALGADVIVANPNTYSNGIGLTEYIILNPAAIKEVIYARGVN